LRDKTSPNRSRLKDKSPGVWHKRAEPDELALETIENRQAGLNRFSEIATAL